MVAHSTPNIVAAQRVQLFANTRLVLPYYLAIKEQQEVRPATPPPAVSRFQPKTR